MREAQMKKVLTLAGILIAVQAFAADPAADAVMKGQAVVDAWLTQTDAGKYGESWEAAASVFKSAVTRAAWEKAMNDSRKPLGAVKSRKLKSATFSTSIPQAPPGEYVIVQYDSVFDGLQGAVETVTAMHETDGSWKAAGYFIRPS
jgi:hypothetical protein